ncbi:hypothetical protein NB700_001875 [Xanthomonas sacchari]|uniref:Uncharacterized protein n=1 Tax=Xanthomonas sacchari TaxID=56458 RepID=A0ABT3DWK3_9XANT|nr:hypothetical protein [Xanthomonas sacchari]MCW0399319.1 hypothetical protein [Xanthomonas sacchari]
MKNHRATWFPYRLLHEPDATVCNGLVLEAQTYQGEADDQANLRRFTFHGFPPPRREEAVALKGYAPDATDYGSARTYAMVNDFRPDGESWGMA